MLDEKVQENPALYGGNIRIESLEDGMLRVRLLGRCNDYPFAELTMARLLREELTAAFSSLRSISLVAGVSDELIDAAHGSAA